MMKVIIIFILFTVLFFPTMNFRAQEDLTSDELFLLARNKAFEDDNYSAAQQICKRILERSPNYSDVAVFLGRLYTWSDLNDSARFVFDGILKNDSTVYDAYTAYSDLEYWNDNYETAIKILNCALLHFPVSEELLLKKAKVLSADKKYDDAFNTLEVLFKLNNKYEDAILLSERLKEEVRINSVKISYNYDRFDKTFDPWKSTSIAYSRKTPIGTLIGRINYANRFDTDGLQYELDAYPHFADGFYAYLNAGYSTFSIFPKNRFGASLYASLPYSFEVEAGIRYLAFSSSNVRIFTGSIGKYYSNYWFSLRTYITPSISRASHSYSLIVRYYISGADDYLSLGLGTGISPDDRTNGSVLLISRDINCEYQFKIAKRFIVDLKFNFYKDEYSIDNFRNRISLGIGFKTFF